MDSVVDSGVVKVGDVPAIRILPDRCQSAFRGSVMELTTPSVWGIGRLRA